MMLAALLLAGLQASSPAPQLLWEREIGTISRSLVASPDGSVVGEGGRGLICLDSLTGRTRWEIECRANVGAPAVGPDGSVYVAIQDFYDRKLRLHKLEGSTGSAQWRAELDEPDFLAPVVDARAVYLGEGRVTAFSTEDGQQLWTFSRKGRSILEIAQTGGMVLCFLGPTSTTLALDKGDSHQIWSRDAGGWPLRAQGDFIFSNMERFALSNGARLWKASLPCTPIAAGIGPDGDLYCTADSIRDEDRWVARVRAADGAVVWLKQLPQGSAMRTGDTPLVTKTGHVFVQNGKDLFELDASTGRQLWSRSLASDINEMALTPYDVLVVYSGVSAFALR